MQRFHTSDTTCVPVCVCVCVWASNICADQTDLRLTTWLLRGSRVCDVGFVWTAMTPLMNYFINASWIPRALSTGATTVTWAPEPITAKPDSTTHLKKQADLYLQWRELDRDFAGGSVAFCSVHLNWPLWINETKLVWTESVRVWRDTETRGQQSGIGICGCSCVVSC